jgi:exopolyphosphatase/guanosine-5'-triphosphate,3'-diphosphate pyrophosphatase
MNAPRPPESLAKSDAPGRLALGSPIAIVDIGSNSVRLVAYEGLSRAPTPIFNEKHLCGLGRGVATTGRLSSEGVAKAIVALKRFRGLCEVMGVADVRVVATAAARDADNGARFLASAREAIGAPIELLSGRREAELSALGVVAGFNRPDGVAGDLGGGSLELNSVKGARLGRGATLPLGGLALMDVSGKSPRKAAKVARDALQKCKVAGSMEGRDFYAIGGSWRALARLHMAQRNYPLNVMHAYTIPAREASDFAALVERVNVETLVNIESVAPARRLLLPYAAAVLRELIAVAKPRRVVVSAQGVREGLIFERLDEETRRRDPLIVAARDLNILRSRSPMHGEELRDWTDDFMRSTHLDESAEDRRLRHAACLLGDIGWRAHPDYRGEQSLNIIANAGFVGVDHEGRAYLALATSYRHVGPEGDVSPGLRTLASARTLDRAHILGAAMRVAYILSAAMPGVLPRCPLTCGRARLRLSLPPELASFDIDRMQGRVKQLARLIGREPEIVVRR